MSVSRRARAALTTLRATAPPVRAARRRNLLAGVLLPVVLLVPVLAGCSASDAPDGTSAAPVIARLPAVRNGNDLTRKPLSAAGQGTPPTMLVTDDLVTGHGARASATSTVAIQYSGVLWRNGQEFDTTWGSGQTATFPLGSTVAGFGRGIDGMRVGGRRQIVIPPDLGYGPVGGQPPTILADDTLVFVVDLLAVQGGANDGGSGGVTVQP